VSIDGRDDISRRHLATTSRDDISLVEPDDFSYTHTIEDDAVKRFRRRASDSSASS